MHYLHLLHVATNVYPVFCNSVILNLLLCRYRKIRACYCMSCMFILLIYSFSLPHAVDSLPCSGWRHDWPPPPGGRGCAYWQLGWRCIKVQQLAPGVEWQSLCALWCWKEKQYKIKHLLNFGCWYAVMEERQRGSNVLFSVVFLFPVSISKPSTGIW